MAIFSHQRHHWAYVWIPIVGAFIWFATLWAMLITWLASGRPHYVSEDSDQHIAFISDVGADILKPLFIVTCCITAVCFVLSLVVERYLRHSGRLMPNMRTRERVLSTLAIIGSLIGGVGLILLSIFDTKRHPSLHDKFLLVFIVGVALSAIFSIMEFRWISKDFQYVQRLKTSYRMKAVIAVILIALAIAFGVTKLTVVNVAAVLEWAIAFGFTFYLLTFYYDLRQSKGVHKGELNAYRMNQSPRYRMGQAA
ncbi:Frag1/DRAM/Sfk1 [Rhodocollybia butyracea]|uniref:Frag1/DRAM/Sfk1 n=1 Tax=Rhodocollybia butyracea TaxID=206335 RepID=A0A9P5PG09_9AGAR|nr:Frag1/DRAM/Sfk1 [Rhodocollybia butyracea]